MGSPAGNEFGNPEGRPPGKPEGKLPGKPEKPPRNPEGRPVGNEFGNPEGSPVGNGNEGRPVGNGESCPGPKGRLVGNGKLNDPAIPVGKGLGKLGSVEVGRLVLASLGTATGAAKTAAVAESARIRRERMFAVGRQQCMVSHDIINGVRVRTSTYGARGTVSC